MRYHLHLKLDGASDPQEFCRTLIEQLRGARFPNDTSITDMSIGSMELFAGIRCVPITIQLAGRQHTMHVISFEDSQGPSR